MLLTMRIHAIITTWADAPDVPRLDDAWDAETVSMNPAAVRTSLADALSSSEIESATVVVLDVPDAQLHSCLKRPLPIVSTVVDVDQDVDRYPDMDS